MIYLAVTIFLLLLLYQYDIKGSQKNRDRWYHVALIVLVVLAGLRYRLGIDTPMYIDEYYYNIPDLRHIKAEDLSIGNYPLWTLLNSLGRTIGVKFFVIQLIEAAFVNILIFQYIKKHSQYIFTCVFFFFIWMYASYCMEAMKAGFSMTICLFANDYILEKKWGKGALLFFVATLFHPSSLLIAAVSFLTFLKFDRKGFVLLGIVAAFASIIQYAYGDMISLLSFNDDILAKAESYSESSRYFIISGKNINYYIVHQGFLLLSSIVSFFVIKRSSSNKQLMRLEPYLFLGTLFLIISGIIFIFFRVFYFYVIYIILFITQALHVVAKNSNYYARQSALFKLIILIPFLFYIYNTYRGTRWKRYYPYSSVLDRKVDFERERMYDEVRLAGENPVVYEDEY